MLKRSWINAFHKSWSVRALRNKNTLAKIFAIFHPVFNGRFVKLLRLLTSLFTSRTQICLMHSVHIILTSFYYICLVNSNRRNVTVLSLISTFFEPARGFLDLYIEMGTLGSQGVMSLGPTTTGTLWVSRCYFTLMSYRWSTRPLINIS